jgi:hypothetical protein
MEKIDKLQQLMKLLQHDTITPQEVEKFLVMVVESVKKAKDSFERISSENLAQVSEFLEYMQSEHERILSRSQNAIDIAENTLDTFDSKLAEAKSLVAKLRIMEPKNGVDGKDADEEYIISEVLNRIELPEQKEFEYDTGEDIVEKINQLSTDEKYQIDASHIKNLPVGQGVGSTARNLWQLNDVTLSNPTNGQALKYNSTTGQWENGTDSASAGGSDTQVQFNDGGVFGGNEGLVYNKTTRQLSLVSLNQPNGVARLQLQSYDETSTAGGDYSEVIRMDMMSNSAKCALAWRDSSGNSQVWAQAHDYLYWYETINVSAVDTTNDTLTVVGRDMPTGWQVTLTTTGTLPDPLLVSTYYYVRVISANVISLYPTSADASANTNKINLTTAGSGTIAVVPDNDYNYNRHKHWSVEVSKANGEKHTRFSIPYGFDTTDISVFDANLNIISNLFRVLGTAGTYRQIIFGQVPSNSYLPGNFDESPRWALTCDNTAESGSNAGSDFRISRFDDDGNFIAAALFIDRSSGYVGIGDNITSPTAQLQVQRSTDVNVLFGKNTYVGINGSAVFLGEVYDVAGRVFQARLTGDTTARYSVNGAGVTEWGPGGSTARDTNLYRASADNLQTDDNFTALSVTASGATASRVVQFDANKKLESSAVTTTELGYLSGATSSIQGQLNTIVNALTVVAQPDVGNAAGGADTTVYSFTVPANTIDGTRFRGIRVNLSCALSSTAETSTFKIKLNGVTCSTQATANTSAILTWYSFIVRSAGTTARSFGDRISTAGGASGDGNNSITGLDFTANQTFAITIASSTANRGILSNLIVEYI